MSETGESYVALCKCGCGAVVILISQAADWRQNAAKSVAEAVRNGYTIRSMPDAEWRALSFGCKTKSVQEELHL